MFPGPRFTRRRGHRDPRFPVNFGFDYRQPNDNDRRRKAPSNRNATMPAYTVEEPDDNDSDSSTQLPNGTGRMRRNSSCSEHPPETFSWDFFAIGGPERSSVDCWTLPSSASSSPRSPHTAAPPPSPLDSPSLDAQSFPDIREDSPSSTPSRHPSSPHSPRQQEIPAYGDNQGVEHSDQAALDQDYCKLRYLNRKLKRRRDQLYRFQSTLMRKAAELKIRETKLYERETSISDEAPADGPLEY
ncbi:MAG: hypothetical protein Q9201_004008 [Fulgogasparrea decipioides]